MKVQQPVSVQKNKSNNTIQKPVIYELYTDSFFDTKSMKNSKYIKGVHEYLKLYDALWNYIFDDYNRKDNFVKVIINESYYEYMTCAELMVHLIFWRLNIVYSEKLKKKIPITEKNIYDLSKFNQKFIENTLDTLLKQFLEYDKRMDAQDELSFYVSYILDDLIELSEGFSAISCNTISLYEIIQLAHRSKAFKECIDTQLDESKTIRELEAQLKMGKAKVMAAILNDQKNSLIPYIKSNRINEDQFTQMFYAVGPRTDTDKTILPMIMKGNFLKGYQYPSDAYMDAITGRDAQIAKHINVRDSGYLSRKINLACLNTHIDYEVEDCGTKHTLTFIIENEHFLKSIDQKFIVLDNNKLHKIDYKKDTHLIGKTVNLRSHILCALDDDRVCTTCFGGKAARLVGTHIGALPSIKLANPLSKRIMRAKHFTTTNSIEVTSDVLDKYFNVDASKMFVKPDIDVKDTFIIVPREYVEEIVEGNVNTDDDTIEPTLPLESFILQDKGKEHLVECDGLFLSFTDELLEENKKFIIDLESDNALIPLSKIDLDNPLFNIIKIISIKCTFCIKD